jgi:hypothetical protein
VSKAKSQSWLYGFGESDPKVVSQLLERALEIQFQLHESLYLGEYYLFKGKDGEQIRLRKNFDPLDGTPAELEFKELSLLLEVDGYPEGSKTAEDIVRQIQTKIPKAQLLKRSTY